MDIKNITSIAIYYFKNNLRTRCTYKKISHYKETEEGYLFYAYFKCKDRVNVKCVLITKEGKILGPSS